MKVNRNSMMSILALAALLIPMMTGSVILDVAMEDEEMFLKTELVEINCILNLTQKPFKGDIKWYRNDTLLPPSKYIWIVSPTQPVVYCVLPVTETGNYTCVVEDSHHNHVQNATAVVVSVKDKSDPEVRDLAEKEIKLTCPQGPQGTTAELKINNMTVEAMEDSRFEKRDDGSLVIKDPQSTDSLKDIVCDYFFIADLQKVVDSNGLPADRIASMTIPLILYRTEKKDLSTGEVEYSVYVYPKDSGLTARICGSYNNSEIPICDYGSMNFNTTVLLVNFTIFDGIKPLKIGYFKAYEAITTLKPQGDSHTGAIVGGVVGGFLGVIAIIVVVLLLVYCWRKKICCWSGKESTEIQKSDLDGSRIPLKDAKKVSPGGSVILDVAMEDEEMFLKTELVEINCILNLTQKPFKGDIKWYRNDTLLPPSKYIWIVSPTQPVVYCVLPVTETGNYTCVVEDSHHNHVQNATAVVVSVKDKSDPEVRDLAEKEIKLTCPQGPQGTTAELKINNMTVEAMEDSRFEKRDDGSLVIKDPQSTDSLKDIVCDYFFIADLQKVVDSNGLPADRIASMTIPLILYRTEKKDLPTGEVEYSVYLYPKDNGLTARICGSYNNSEIPICDYGSMNFNTTVLLVNFIIFDGIKPLKVGSFKAHEAITTVKPPQGDGNTVAIVCGVVFGSLGVIVIAIILAVLVYFWRKKIYCWRGKEIPESPESMPLNEAKKDENNTEDLQSKEEKNSTEDLQSNGEA